MHLNLSPGTVFHAEFKSGSKIGPKSFQNLILPNKKKQFFLNHVFNFYKNFLGPRPPSQKTNFLLGGGIGWRPFLITTGI